MGEFTYESTDKKVKGTILYTQSVSVSKQIIDNMCGKPDGVYMLTLNEYKWRVDVQDYNVINIETIY